MRDGPRGGAEREGDERDRRIAVLRRGALTCQVVALVFLAFGFWVIAAG